MGFTDRVAELIKWLVADCQNQAASSGHAKSLRAESRALRRDDGLLSEGV